MAGAKNNAERLRLRQAMAAAQRQLAPTQKVNSKGKIQTKPGPQVPSYKPPGLFGLFSQRKPAGAMSQNQSWRAALGNGKNLKSVGAAYRQKMAGAKNNAERLRLRQAMAAAQRQLAPTQKVNSKSRIGALSKPTASGVSGGYKPPGLFSMFRPLSKPKQLSKTTSAMAVAPPRTPVLVARAASAPAKAGGWGLLTRQRNPVVPALQAKPQPISKPQSPGPLAPMTPTRPRTPSLFGLFRSKTPEQKMQERAAKQARDLQRKREQQAKDLQRKREQAIRDQRRQQERAARQARDQQRVLQRKQEQAARSQRQLQQRQSMLLKRSFSMKRRGMSFRR